jgi:hypothetical protein
VGALCFSRGEQHFSVAEKSWTLICALALASKPRAKARPFGMNCFSAGLKSSSPLLKQGLPPDSGWMISAAYLPVLTQTLRPFKRTPPKRPPGTTVSA